MCGFDKPSPPTQTRIPPRHQRQRRSKSSPMVPRLWLVRPPQQTNPTKFFTRHRRLSIRQQSRKCQIMDGLRTGGWKSTVIRQRWKEINTFSSVLFRSKVVSLEWQELKLYSYVRRGRETRRRYSWYWKFLPITRRNRNRNTEHRSYNNKE